MIEFEEEGNEKKNVLLIKTEKLINSMTSNSKFLQRYNFF